MQSRWFEGPAGRLDARLQGPADGSPVVLLHPHPQWGGTMGSRLVYDLAQALAEHGFLAVRFDFRGVGRSAGTYGQGLGESDDAATVFDAVAEETGVLPALVGYSFGGGVACHLATRRKPRHLVLVATPLALTASKLVPEQDAPNVRSPVDVVVGDGDGFVPLPDADRLAAAFRPPAQRTVLPGAAHFLEPSHNPQAVAAILAALGRNAAPAHG